MKHINFGARTLDEQRIELIRFLCPDIDNTTDAIREALRQFEAHADPVQLEYAKVELRNAARKQARKAGKK